MVATQTKRKQHDRQRADQNGDDGHKESDSRGSRYVYDPFGYVRVERLRLARQWAQQGALYQAIFAYNDMLIRYAGTGAGEAAAEELLEMVPVLEQQGKYYTILDLLRKVEYAG